MGACGACGSGLHVALCACYPSRVGAEGFKLEIQYTRIYPHHAFGYIYFHQCRVFLIGVIRKTYHDLVCCALRVQIVY
jgi:hypothetical protein